MKNEKERIIETIERIESNDYPNTFFVILRNVKIKVRSNLIIADVLVYNNYENTVKRYNKREYDLIKIKEMI